MKTKWLIDVLLGGFLVLQVCPKSTAADFTFLTIVDGFQLAAVGGGKITSNDKSLNWFAPGVVESPFDASSMYGSVHLSGGGSIFTGYGNMGVNVGSYDNQPSVSVSGLEDVYMLIKVTGAVNYHFVSTVSAKGSVEGSVTWDGLENSGADIDGTRRQSGTLLPGVFELDAGMSNPGDGKGSGSWSYSLSLTPADIVPGRLSAAQKADSYEQSSALQFLINSLITAANSGSYDELRQALLADALGLAALQKTLAENYLDPPDTNYTVLAQAVAPAVTPLAASGDITQSEADAYNMWQTNLSQSAGYGTALTTSLNREQGAATAGSSYWATTQMNAAVQFEAQLAALSDQEPALRSNVVAQFQAGGFPGIMVTTNDAINLQLQMITNGLPADLLNTLTALGVDPGTITNIEYTLLTADPGSMAGGFPGGLVNTNLDSTARALAAGLRDASLMLINTSVLPGGHFRFDLPTVPGYTYTIQFSENLADRAAWTTLLATNATTPLLSFTNTPAAGAQAGFYRASHN